MLQDFYEHHDSIQARVQKSNYHSHLITTKPQFDVTAEIISTIEGQTKLLALACIIYCTKGILLEKNVMQVFIFSSHTYVFIVLFVLQGVSEEPDRRHFLP